MARKPLRSLSACLALVFPSAALGAVAAADVSPQVADAAGGPRTCADGDLVPTASNLRRVRMGTLCLINQQRAARGLARLRNDAALHNVAQRHSAEMVAGDFFAHDHLTLGPVSGENIAAGSGPLATPSATVVAWMNSPEHRANILNPAFRETGIGAVASTPSMLGSAGIGATYTQCFSSGR
jgi:uncharacterized protein YkwD